MYKAFSFVITNRGLPFSPLSEIAKQSYNKTTTGHEQNIIKNRNTMTLSSIIFVLKDTQQYTTRIQWNKLTIANSELCLCND